MIQTVYVNFKVNTNIFKVSVSICLFKSRCIEMTSHTPCKNEKFKKCLKKSIFISIFSRQFFLPWCDQYNSCYR